MRLSVHQLLTDFAALLRDLPPERSASRERLELLYRSLDLSSESLAGDPGRLISELWGRLAASGGALDESFLQPAIDSRKESWLRPVTASFHQATGPLRRTLRHEGRDVQAFTISQDSSKVAAIHDALVMIWDIRTGALLQTIKLDFNYGTYAMCFDDSGNQLFLGTRMGHILVLDLARREITRKVEAHESAVWRMVVIPDQHIVISARGTVLKFWALPDWTLIDTWEPAIEYELKSLPPGRIARSESNKDKSSVTEGPSIETMRLSADGRRLVVAWHAGYVTVFDVAERREHWHLRADLFAMFYSVDFSHDGRFAVAPYNQIYVWDVESGEIVRKIQEPGYIPTAVACSRDFILSSSDFADFSLRTWDLATGRMLHHIHGQTGMTRQIVISRDSHWALTTADDRVRVWDLTAMTDAKPHGHGEKVFEVQVTRDGTRALTTSHDRTIRIWDTRSGRELLSIRCKRYFVFTAQFSGDGERVLACPDDLTLWDARSGEERCTVARSTFSMIDERVGLGVRPTQRFGMSADGQRIVFLSLERTSRLLGDPNDPNAKWERIGERQFITLWDVERRAVLHSFPVECNGVDRLFVTRDGARIVALARRPTERSAEELHCMVWDCGTATWIGMMPIRACWERGRQLLLVDREQRVIDFDSGSVYGSLPPYASVAAVAGDGSRAVVRGIGGSQVWAFPECRMISRHPDGKLEALNADGSRLALAQGASMQLWDVDSSQCLGSCSGDGAITAIALTPDGRTLLAGEDAGRVHVFQQA